MAHFNFREVWDNIRSRSALYYIAEDADWIIKNIGSNIAKRIPNIESRVTTIRYGLRNSIVHFGSFNIYCGVRRIHNPHNSNRTIVTWFHVPSGDKRVEIIRHNLSNGPDRWHTACTLTFKQMVQIGIPPEKIVIIPLGIDLEKFRAATQKERWEQRKRFNIPDDHIVIGSFMKDGNGWGEGLEPKMIKGPDVLCDVLASLSSRHKIFVLLTGPARGYVKSRLKSAGIPYYHSFVEDADQVEEYYRATDISLVCSRIEGGPKQILESLACGVPIVSTRVGMAPDVVIDGENGFLADVSDREGIARKVDCLIENEIMRQHFISSGLKTVKHYDWDIIADRYYNNLYAPLLKGLR